MDGACRTHRSKRNAYKLMRRSECAENRLSVCENMVLRKIFGRISRRAAADVRLLDRVATGTGRGRNIMDLNKKKEQAMLVVHLVLTIVAETRCS